MNRLEAMSHLRSAAPVAALGIAALALAGCSATSAPADTAAPESSAEASTITLYTSEPQEKADELVAAFNEVHPEITVEVFRAGTGDLTTRIAAEQEAGEIQADVLLALGRRDEARLWARAVRVAEKALGVGGFADPEIIDVDTEPVEDPRDRRPSPRERRYERSAAEAGAEPTADGSPAEQPEAAAEPTEAPRQEAASEPPAAVDAPDEVDPNQLSLFDALEAPEADGR